LGLPIVREIVHRHRGTVTLDSAGERGVLATIRLPALPAARAEEK
jgi:signal transduction histidine kinase